MVSFNEAVQIFLQMEALSQIAPVGFRITLSMGMIALREIPICAAIFQGRQAKLGNI
jgi:hypothetical protein